MTIVCLKDYKNKYLYLIMKGLTSQQHYLTHEKGKEKGFVKARLQYEEEIIVDCCISFVDGIRRMRKQRICQSYYP